MSYKGVWCSTHEWLAVVVRNREIRTIPDGDWDDDLVVTANEFGLRYDGFHLFDPSDEELGAIEILEVDPRHKLLKAGDIILTDGVDCVYLRACQ